MSVSRPAAVTKMRRMSGVTDCQFAEYPRRVCHSSQAARHRVAPPRSRLAGPTTRVTMPALFSKEKFEEMRLEMDKDGDGQVEKVR